LYRWKVSRSLLRCGRPKRARSSFLLLTARTRTLRRSGVRSVAVAVPVLAAGEDANDAGAGPLGEAVLREAGGAGTVHGLGEGAGEPDALVELAIGELPGVAGELARRRLDDERRAEKVEDSGPDAWYTPQLSPRLQNRPGDSTAETPADVVDSTAHPGRPGEGWCWTCEPRGGADE
jgi:hypothetical protein